MYKMFSLLTSMNPDVTFKLTVVAESDVTMGTPEPFRPVFGRRFGRQRRYFAGPRRPISFQGFRPFRGWNSPILLEIVFQPVLLQEVFSAPQSVVLQNAIFMFFNRRLLSEKKNIPISHTMMQFMLSVCSRFQWSKSWIIQFSCQISSKYKCFFSFYWFIKIS